MKEYTYNNLKNNVYLKDALIDAIELAARKKEEDVEEDVRVFMIFNGVSIYIESRSSLAIPPIKIIEAVKKIREKTRKIKSLEKKERRRERMMIKYLHRDNEVIIVEEKIKKLTEMYFFKLKDIKKNKERNRKRKEWKELRKMED